MTITPRLLREHGRVFYYAATRLPTCHTEVIRYADNRGWRVIGAWSMSRGETMWKMEQVKQRFIKGSQWEIVRNGEASE